MRGWIRRLSLQRRWLLRWRFWGLALYIGISIPDMSESMELSMAIAMDSS